MSDPKAQHDVNQLIRRKTRHRLTA
jgi:hypothetical protein